MRRVPYSDIQIYPDPRIPVVKKILSGIMSDLEMRETIITVMPDNNMIAICKLTTVFCCNLKECIPGYKIVIDSLTFDKDFAEKNKLTEEEFVSFNQNSSSIYLNIEAANQSYFYNLPNYILVDKIEDITSFEDFQYYINLKADDGSKVFKGYNNKFIVPIFTKFPNISKSDTADLYIYNYDNESDLVVWKVKKKKFNRDIYTIFRVLKLM